MKTLATAIAIGPLIMTGPLPAASQSGLGSGASVRLVANHDSTADRETYTQKARDEMQLWQQKLHDFDAKARAKASDAHRRAAKDLDSAWTEAKSASDRLDTASERDWSRAKASFQTASTSLTWRGAKLTRRTNRPNHPSDT
jgi:hypothetical protein